MRLIIIFLYFFSCVSHVDAYQINRECVIFVEPGDSFTKLFGKDWLRVVRENKKLAFYDEHGRLVPDKLVAGTVLKIPNGTYLTMLAVTRLNQYEKIRNAALKSFQKAKQIANQSENTGSEIYAQAMEAVKKARDAISGVGFGFKNYIEAEKLSQQAVKFFGMDANIRSADHNAEKLKKQIKEMTNQNRISTQNILSKRKQVKKLNHQRKTLIIMIFILTTTLILSLAMFYKIRSKRKLEYELAVRSWLNEHTRRISNIINK